jgi:hypothetical protein
MAKVEEILGVRVVVEPDLDGEVPEREPLAHGVVEPRLVVLEAKVGLVGRQGSDCFVVAVLAQVPAEAGGVVHGGRAGGGGLAPAGAFGNARLHLGLAVVVAVGKVREA